jgi:hypothetical protein
MSDAADGLSIAGVIGGAATVLGLLGSGIWRLITRADRKEERLQEKEEAKVAKLESRVAALEEEYRKLWIAFGFVATGLHALDPFNHNLGQAARILGAKFPIDLNTPKDMTEPLSKIG